MISLLYFFLLYPTKILPKKKKTLLTKKPDQSSKDRIIDGLEFFDLQEDEEYYERVNHIIQLFAQLFPLLSTVPNSLVEFTSELSKNLDFLSLETIQNYNVIPFFAEIFNSDPNEQILCLALTLIDYFLKLDFSMLVILDQYQIFTIITNFFDSPSDQVRIDIANIFHRAIFHEYLNDEVEITINILYKVIDLFFQISFIWAADVNHEELQFICLDFQLIVLSIFNQYEDPPFTDETIAQINELYISVFQVGTDRLKKCSLGCLIKIMLIQKKYQFEPSQMIAILLSTLKLQINDIDRYIFQFLVILTTILSDEKKNKGNMIFIHQLIDFNFLCEKMVTSSDQEALYWLTLWIYLIIEYDPDCIEILLKTNYIQYTKKILDSGNVSICLNISGSFKNIFFLANPQQLLLVFQSGIIQYLFQFFNDSLNDTTSAVFYAICGAVEKCTQALGNEVLQKIQTIFLNEAMENLQNLRDCDYKEIPVYADQLFDLLGLED